MAQQTLQCGMGDRYGWFEIFFRRIPEHGGFAIAAGLEPVLQELARFSFDEETLAFLRKQGGFEASFLEYLRCLRFSGDVYAVAEGTPIFPGEPILQLRVPLPVAYLLETRLIQKLGYATLIATKASRMVRAAKEKPLWEFGARRAHGVDAAIEGARAAYLAGFAGTSCVAAQQAYDIPVMGTMGHAFVQQFSSEYAAFCAWCKHSPERATLLVDTYDTCQSGVPHAIRAFQEVLLPRGITEFAVRLDSGDLAALSKETRHMLDEAGLSTCRIFASNALDEYRIQTLEKQGAAIDGYGVGERLITAKQEPVLGCVMKLAALVQKDGTLIPKFKRGETHSKSTLPDPKQIWRKFASDGTCVGDWIASRGEPMESVFSIHPDDPLSAKPLLMPVVRRGASVQAMPTLMQSRQYAAKQLKTLPERLLRLSEPGEYPIHLSPALAAKSRALWRAHES